MIPAASGIGPEDWEDGIALAIFLQPNIAPDECGQIVKTAAHKAQQNTSARREDRKYPPEQKPKLQAWQLPNNYCFYAWILQESVMDWRPLGSVGPPNSLTNRLFIAALLASGLIGTRGRLHTPVWLAAALLDVLRRAPRAATIELRDLLFDPTGTNSRKDPEDGYGAIVNQCIDRICTLTGLEPDPNSGRKGKPAAIAGLIEVPPGLQKAFWTQEWCGVRPAERLRHFSVYDKRPTRHLDKLHVISCRTCLSIPAGKDNWHNRAYLPNPVKDMQEPNPSSTPNGPGGPGEKPNSLEPIARRMAEEFEEETRARAAAAGRVMVSIDGSAPVLWESSLSFAPRFTIELFRGGVPILWHEVDHPGSTIEPSTTEYRVGAYHYWVYQDSGGVKIGAEPVKTAFSIQWLSRPLFRRLLVALPALLFLISLAVPPTRPSGARVERVQAGASSLGARPTRNIEVDVASPTFPWSSYSLRAITERTSFACSPSNQPAGFSRTLLFTCGAEWDSVDPLRVQFQLVEKRWGLVERVSSTFEFVSDPKQP